VITDWAAFGSVENRVIEAGDVAWLPVGAGSLAELVGAEDADYVNAEVMPPPLYSTALLCSSPQVVGLPGGARVTGIEFLLIGAAGSGFDLREDLVEVWRDGASAGSNLAQPEVWPRQWFTRYYGGAGNMCGTGALFVTPGSLAELQFAFRVKSLSQDDTMDIDRIAVRFHYSVGGSGVIHGKGRGVIGSRIVRPV